MQILKFEQNKIKDQIEFSNSINSRSNLMLGILLDKVQDGFYLGQVHFFYWSHNCGVI